MLALTDEDPLNTTPPPRRLAARLTPWLAPFFVGMGAHATALRAGFVWLDHAHIERRLALADPSPARWLALFQRPFAETGFYRPLVAVSLSIDAIVGAPWFFHLVNLLLHGVTASLVGRAARSLGVAPRVATAAALVFAAHPIGSIVADAIAFRSESMALASLLVLLIAVIEKRPVLSAIAAIVAGLSKETSLVVAPFIPALVVGFDAGGASIAARLRANARTLGSTLFALGVALALRVAFAPPFRAAPLELSASAWAALRLENVARLARSLVVPTPARVCDAVPIEGLGARLSIAGVALSVGAVWLLWVARRRLDRGARVALALFAVTSAQVLQIVPIMRWWSPHYAYLPLGFLAIAIAAIVPDALGRGRRAAVAFVVATLGAVSLFDGQRFADDRSLFAPEIEANDACREAHFFLGEAARSDGDRARARDEYEAALAPRADVVAYVDRSAATQNLGVTLAELGDFDGAVARFREALSHAPSESARRELVHDLATAMLASGDAEAAFTTLEPELARPEVARATLVIALRAARLSGRGDIATALAARLAEGSAPR